MLRLMYLLLKQEYLETMHEECVCGVFSSPFSLIHELEAAAVCVIDVKLLVVGTKNTVVLT